MRFIGPVLGLFIFGYFAWFLLLGASDPGQTGHGKRASWDAVIRYDCSLDARGGFRGTRVRFGVWPWAGYRMLRSR